MAGSVDSVSMIACIGWGSLLWNPGQLPLSGTWNPDGPELGVEFARQAANDRITLVVVEGGARCRTLWAPLAVGSAADARRVLAAREGCEERWIGVWPGAADDLSADHWTPGPAPPGYQAVAQWADERELSAVVWTGLPFGLQGARGIVPSADEVIDFLRRLAGRPRERAEEYIRRTPAQTQTPYRRRIETALGLA